MRHPNFRYGPNEPSILDHGRTRLHDVSVYGVFVFGARVYGVLLLTPGRSTEFTSTASRLYR